MWGKAGCGGRKENNIPSDGIENGGPEEGVGGKTNADNGTLGADVFGSLLEGFLVDSEKDDSLGTVTLGGDLLDVLDDVLAGHEVDVGNSAEFLAHLLLLGTAVDGDGVQTHGAGVLDSHATKTTTSTDNGDVLTSAGT